MILVFSVLTGFDGEHTRCYLGLDYYAVVFDSFLYLFAHMQNDSIQYLVIFDNRLAITFG